MDAMTANRPASAAPPVRVLIVDDHEVVRLGLRAVLASVAGVTVVGEAATAAGALREAERLRPDVVVLDVRLPDGSGIEVCREIRGRRAETHVLMLTSYSDEEALFAAIMAGAAGYLLKDARGDDLVHAIRTVGSGASLLDPSLTEKVLRWLRRAQRQPAEPSKGAAGDPFSELSEQERRILDLMAQGKTNREIGRAVYLSDKTVKHYVSDILRKLHVSRRSEAAALWAAAKTRGEAAHPG